MTSLRSPHASKIGEPLLHVVPLPARAMPLQSPACFSMDLSRRAKLMSEALHQLRSQSMQLARAADILIDSLLGGRRILASGLGGSAATAQHFAAEVIARHPGERAPHLALALIPGAYPGKSAGDAGEPDDAFSRQIAAYGHPGDVLVAFSTSGGPGTLVRAARTASAMGMTVVTITGPCPNQLATAADVSIAVSTSDAQVVREAHVVVLHLLCEAVERAVAGAMMDPRLG